MERQFSIPGQQRGLAYHLLLTSLISHRNEDLMKRNGTNESVFQNGTANFRLTGWISQTGLRWKVLLVCRKFSGRIKRLHLISNYNSFPRIRTCMLPCLCASKTERLKHAAYHTRLLLCSNVVPRVSLLSAHWRGGDPGNEFDAVAGYAGIRMIFLYV